MKVWEKIYIGTLGAFLVILNICIASVFYLSYNNSLYTEKNTVYSEWNSICSAFKEESEDSNASVSAVFQEYVLKYHNSGLNLELWNEEDVKDADQTEAIPFSYYELDDDEDGYSHMSDKFFQMLENVGYYERMLVTEENDEKKIIVAGRIKVDDTSFIFVVHKTLVGFKAVWMEMIVQFLVIELIAVLLISIVLYFFLKKVLCPLEDLEKAADSMASGCLDQAVTVKGKDEIAHLALSFNHMASEVSKTMKQLEEEAKNKQQFIDDLAHEIRTPLTTIQGYSQLMKNVKMPEEKRIKYLSYMMNESKRIQIMSDDLLKLTLMKREPLEFSWFENETFITNAVEPMVDIANEQNISILIETDHKKSYGHLALLQNVIVNLIKNAMNACSEGGEIIVGVYENHFVVSDNGIGMDEECANKLFEPFYREDKARSRKAFGAGLGLTIVKEIVDRHHGEITVSSQKEKGTRIELVLPKENLTTSE